MAKLSLQRLGLPLRVTVYADLHGHDPWIDENSPNRVSKVTHCEPLLDLEGGVVRGLILLMGR